MNDTVHGRFNTGSLTENVEAENERQGPNDHIADFVWKHDAQSKNGQHGAEWNHDSRAPFWVFKGLDDVIVRPFNPLGLSNDDLLDVVNPNLRSDDGEDAFVFGAVGHEDGLVGLERRDDLIKLSGDSAIRTHADLLVAGEDGDFNLVFLRLAFHEFVIHRKGPEDSVGVAFLRVGNTELEGGREDLPSSDNGSADGGFETEVIVPVNRNHQCPCHLCIPVWWTHHRSFIQTLVRKTRPKPGVSGQAVDVRRRTAETSSWPEGGSCQSSSPGKTSPAPRLTSSLASRRCSSTRRSQSFVSSFQISHR